MEEKFVDVKGIRTRYLEGGTGEHLVLVHGGHYGMNCSANDWDTVFMGFEKAFHVLALDKVGQGFSDNPKGDEDYVMATMVQHVCDFIKALGVDRTHLVGHSRGGYMVCRIALEHPEVVNKLVMVDCGTLTLARNPLYDQWEKEMALIEDKREGARYFWAANSFSDDHLTDEFLDRLMEINNLPKSREAVAKMKAGLMSQFKANLADELGSTHEWIKSGGIKAPLLIMWGYNDPTANIDPMGVETMHLLLSSTPDSQMHILNQAGHWSFREQSDNFVAAVTSFINSD